MPGEQILVVEDQRAVAGALRMRLRGLGYDVMGVATDGHEAIEKARKLRPDLILMDIKLGTGMDGIETAHLIRAVIDIPVIYISAHVDRKLLERARATQPAGFITKPFTTKDLMTAIDLALHRAEDDLQLSGKAVRELPSQPLQGILTTDMEGRIGFVNEDAERILGWHRRQLLGRPIEAILSEFHHVPSAEAQNLVNHVLQQDKDEALSRPGSAADNSPPTRDTLTALQDSQGNTYGLVLRLGVESSDEKRSQKTLDNGLDPCAVALDAIQIGVVITDFELRLLHTNNYAEKLFSRDCGIERREHRLALKDKSLHEQLQRQFEDYASDTPTATGPANAMFVPIPHAKEQLELVIARLPRNGKDGAKAIIYVFDPYSHRRISYDVLTGLYRLTQAEAKLVQLLSGGMTLDDAADELQISVNTARTHLKHVFHKTGINRQTDLIHRIETGSAALLLEFEHD